MRGDVRGGALLRWVACVLSPVCDCSDMTTTTASKVHNHFATDDGGGIYVSEGSAPPKFDDASCMHSIKPAEGFG